MTVMNSTLHARGSKARVLADEIGNVTVSDSTIEEEGAESTGAFDELANLTIRGSRLNQRMGEEISVEELDGHVTLEHDNVAIEGDGEGVGVEGATLALTSDNFTVNAPTDVEPVIDDVVPAWRCAK